MADFQVSWTDAARLDLEGIIEFITEENPANARAVLARMERRCQALTVLPGGPGEFDDGLQHRSGRGASSCGAGRDP